MANEHGLFFDSVNGDRVYNSDSFAEWLRKFFTTGVFNGDLQVQPLSGMAVTVGTGYANIDGRVRFFDTTQTKMLPVANGTYPRIDTVVVRLDLGNREITCEIVQGMYSGNNPSPTAPVRSDGIYEIVLAQIYVGAGVTEITAINITDTRANETICGWVTSTVEGVPMSQIVSQMQADFLTWYDHMKGQLDEDAAGHLQQEIDTISSAVTSINTKVGTNDISTIGDGTITGAVQALNNNLKRKYMQIGTATLNTTTQRSISLTSGSFSDFTDLLCVVDDTSARRGSFFIPVSLFVTGKVNHIATYVADVLRTAVFGYVNDSTFSIRITSVPSDVTLTFRIYAK